MNTYTLPLGQLDLTKLSEKLKAEPAKLLTDMGTYYAKGGKHYA